MIELDEKALNRFINKIAFENDCWLFTSSLNGDGYGTFSTVDGVVRGHQMSYHWWHGALQNGLEIDHICQTRNCVNPDHLEAVTHKENVLRGNAWAAHLARQQVCAKCGGEFSIEPNGKRRCIPCRKAYDRERWLLNGKR